MLTLSTRTWPPGSAVAPDIKQAVRRECAEKMEAEIHPLIEIRPLIETADDDRSEDQTWATGER